MSRVKNKNTLPELVVRRILHRLGGRFRLHKANLPGRPDIVMPSRKLAIFVHGCFWHAHECRAGRRPSANQEFWMEKSEANRRRDDRKVRELQALGWKTEVIWECETRDEQRLEAKLLQLLTDYPRARASSLA
nr:very short patch repair endonuclease [Devosia sp. A16]